MGILDFGSRKVKAELLATAAELSAARAELDIATSRSADLSSQVESIPTLVREAQAEAMRALITPTPTPTIFPNSVPRQMYKVDQPWRFLNITSPRRRPDSPVTQDVLRRVAATYDPLRAILEHLKRQVRESPFSVQPRDTAKSDGQALQSRIDEATAYFKPDGGIGGYGRNVQHFESALIEDLLVLGCFAVFMERDNIDRLRQAFEIDAITIKPVVDAFGWDPDGPSYEQWVYGLNVCQLTNKELYYSGLIPQTNSPYFVSPLEYLLSPTTSGMKADEWTRSWLTDGNTPADMLALPEDWTPEQVQQFSDWWDALLSGDTQGRARTRFVPSGTKNVAGSRGDWNFFDAEMWFARRCGAIYGVKLDECGLEQPMSTDRRNPEVERPRSQGTLPLLEQRKMLYDHLLEVLGYPDLEIADNAKERESPAARAQRLMVASGGPWMSVNEARKEDGHAPMKGKEHDEIRPSQTGDQNASGNKAGNKDDGSKAKKTSTDKRTRADLVLWMEKAISRINRGLGADCAFTSEHIDSEDLETIGQALKNCDSSGDVVTLFAGRL